MKFSKLINEIKEADTTDIPSLMKGKTITFITFDTETTGLFGDDTDDPNKLPVIISRKIKESIEDYYVNVEKLNKKEAKEKRQKEFRFEKYDLQLVEIAAIAITFENGKIKGQLKKFHKFIKLNKEQANPTRKSVKEWNEKKELIAEGQKEVLSSFYQWLKQFPNKVLIAHNLKKFDLPIIKRMSAQHGIELDSAFKDNDRLIDTINTKQLRMLIDLPKGTNQWGKQYDINNQNDLLKQFGMVNRKAHTALADAYYLGKLIKKMLIEYEKAKTTQV